uniref:Oligomycin sensitivity conferral protein n=1 Tax=Maconellicoccus hirsutus TaxID=177089 RepID=A2I441_MACHI|nr:putative mitochondrial ATP synthase O subunit [Maconellicoccus hirsutus]
MASVKALSLLNMRKFSTSSVSNQLVKAPLQLFGIEGRYIMALYSAAVKQKQIESVEKDMEKISSSLNADKAFHEFVTNPVIPKNLKTSAIKEIASKLSLSAPSSNFLALLAENGRLKSIQTMTTLFKQVMSAHRGDLVVEVTLAKAIDDSIKQELQAVLQKFAKKGEKLILNYKINPDILGGMIVSIGDRYVDMSTASKVKKYSDILKSSV